MARPSKIESVGLHPEADWHSGGGDPKIWRAQQNTRDFYKILTKPYNSPLDLKWIVTQTYASTSDLKKMLKRIDDYASGTKVRNPLTGECYSDPYEDSQFITELINNLLEQWNELSKDFDGASKVSMRDYMLRETKFDFDLFSSEFYLNWATEGSVAVVSGSLGSGKTDFAGKLAEMAITDKGWRVFGNIELRYDVDGYVYCSTFSKLVRLICDSKLHGIQSLMITDEAGLDFPSYEASTRASKEFDKFMKLTRKFKTAHEFIIQYTTQIPWVLRRNYSAWFHKYNKKTLRYELRKGSRAYKDILIHHVPRTDLPFDTDHIAGMDMDIEVRDMLDFLEQLPPRSNQFAELKNWVEIRTEGKDRELTQGEKKRLALALMEKKRELGKDAKLTTEIIAESVGAGESTVRKWDKDQRREARKVGGRMTVRQVEERFEELSESDEDSES